MKTKLRKADGALYSHENKITIYREYGKSPNGNEINGHWVYRKDGLFIDMDQYQKDLMQRHDLLHPYEVI